MDLTQMISLTGALQNLDIREMNILMEYYIYGYKEREIAEHYNISQQMVNKIKKRALKKCKIQLSVATV